MSKDANAQLTDADHDTRVACLTVLNNSEYLVNQTDQAPTYTDDVNCAKDALQPTSNIHLQGLSRTGCPPLVSLDDDCQLAANFLT